MSEKTHTELSPSNSERWLNCPGSVALCARMPKPEQSVYAGEGQAAHELLDRCLKNPKILPYDQVGTEIEGFEVTEEMAEAVTLARDTILAELRNGGKLLTDKQVTILPGIKGTLDAAIVRHYDTVIVYDFKYGKGVIVPAVDNPQLLLYALPLSKEYEAEHVKLVIIQPRTEGQVSTWDADCEYLNTFAAEVERKIALTKEENALVTAGPWCKFCWAKAICPALRQDIRDQLPAIPGKELILPDTKALSSEIVKRVLDNKDRLEDWLDAVAAYAQDYIEAGGTIPGWELGKKRANRRWKDEVAALQAFADLGDKAYKVQLLSPAQMEKVAGKERVAVLTEVPDNGMTLKRVTDAEKPKKEKTK